jgi:GAF domain-containing protein
VSTPAEDERIRVLQSFAVMDTEPDAELDELVQLASSICGVPIALISLLDETRQWFKAKVGIDTPETPREMAFCAHAIEAPEPALFTVRDAREDARFATNPLVTAGPEIVFYAGAPLVADGGARLGTLCVIDRQPRVLTTAQEQALQTLSRVVVRELELRRALRDRQRLLAETEAARRSVDLQREHLLRAFTESPVAVGDVPPVGSHGCRAGRPSADRARSRGAGARDPRRRRARPPHRRGVHRARDAHRAPRVERHSLLQLRLPATPRRRASCRR